MANQDFLIRTVFDLVGMLSKDEIIIPTNYRDRVLLAKKSLENDVSGCVSSMLDLAIKSACVKFTVETSNPVLTKVLNDWLDNVNQEFVGQIPVGNRALSREYFRERWKGSSLCLLRTAWDDVNGFTLPTALWFIDGEDIVVKDTSPGQTVTLGSMSYFINPSESYSEDNLIPIKNDDSNYYFVQKPFCSWTTKYPNPFVVQRGIYENLELLRILVKRGEKIANRAIEYLLQIKKGTEKLAEKGTADTIYDDKDLKEIKERFKNMIEEERFKRGTPVHVTNFDTDISDYSPDLSKVMGSDLYIPVEKRILNALGIIEFIPTTQIQPRQPILNPVPFIAEINQGIEDYKTLLTDILRVIVIRNKNHPKYSGQILKVNSAPITQFITADILNHLRSAYDRGVLSKQTYCEIVGEDYEVQRNRRITERDNNDDNNMYPPQIQGVPTVPLGQGDDSISPDGTKDTQKKEKTTPDKQGPEAKNFNNNSLELTCRNNHKFKVDQKLQFGSLNICNCPDCSEEVNY